MPLQPQAQPGNIGRLSHRFGALCDCIDEAFFPTDTDNFDVIGGYDMLRSHFEEFSRCAGYLRDILLDFESRLDFYRGDNLALSNKASRESMALAQKASIIELLYMLKDEKSRIFYNIAEFLYANKSIVQLRTGGNRAGSIFRILNGLDKIIEDTLVFLGFAADSNIITVYSNILVTEVVERGKIIDRLRKDEGSLNFRGPEEPEHPGKLIEKYFIDHEWSIPYAAERLGFTRELIYKVMRGASGISTSMARALERNQIGESALDWLILQAKHDLAQPERPVTPQRHLGRRPKA